MFKKIAQWWRYINADKEAIIQEIIMINVDLYLSMSRDDYHNVKNRIDELVDKYGASRLNRLTKRKEEYIFNELMSNISQ